MKKIIILICLFLSPVWWLYAYNSDDIVNISFTWINNISNVYSVPLGKDLLIKEVYVSSDSANIVISNNWFDILANIVGSTSYDTNIIIKDNLYIEQNPNTNNIYYTFFWFLVNENDNIENIVNNNDNWFNKNIFTMDSLNEIYMYEFIVLLIIYIIVFFEKILWKRNRFMRK